jgi:hypothetical protein
MQSQKEIEIETIREGMRDYTNQTYFVANHIKCNLATRARISSLITEKGEIEGLGLRVLIDNDVDDNIAHIGMGAGPTFAKINI